LKYKIVYIEIKCKNLYNVNRYKQKLWLNMEKLNITKSAKLYFKNLSVDCINNVCGAVYLTGSMRNITAAVSKLLQINPGVRVQCMNTATVEIIESKDGNKAIVNASVIFDLSGKIEENLEGE